MTRHIINMQEGTKLVCRKTLIHTKKGKAYGRQWRAPTGLVFIRISTQPRISAHLEKAPILKAEKVNKRPPLPNPTPTPTQTEIGAQPLTPTTPQKGISTNNRLARRRSFLQSVLQKPCFVTSSRFVITIYCFVAKYTCYTS